jgi:D-arabinose 1-dehydrogenase-like Zn-dependent alcohol dehydrogenase
LNYLLIVFSDLNMAESSSTNPKSGSGIPSVMKAAQQSGFGEARQVLTLSENVPVPRELSSKQILVRVHAASINPIDWKTLNGNLSLVTRFSFPHIPGKDVAGVIVDVGSGVKRFQVGDKVYGNLGMNDGSYAEYVRGDESVFALKPNNLSMEEAAAVPLACETSYQALFNKSSPPIGPGSKILIAGGSTATGLYAIQLAKAVGAYVTATSSQRNFGLLEKLGWIVFLIYVIKFICLFSIGYNITQTNSETNNDSNQLHIIDYNEKDFGQELQGLFLVLIINLILIYF